MTKVIIIILSFFLSLGCSFNDSTKKVNKSPEIPKVSKGSFGKQITETNIINAPLLTKILQNNNTTSAKVKGFIIESCTHSGCWMDIYLGRNKTMHVTFRDNKFAIPLDAQNKTAIFQGKVFREIINFDNKKDTIYTFIADGVIIK